MVNATMVAHDVFEGDVYRIPRRMVGLEGGGTEIRAFVWSVSDDGTVGLYEMVSDRDHTGRVPRRWAIPVSELGALTLVEKNGATRREGSR